MPVINTFVLDQKELTQLRQAIANAILVLSFAYRERGDSDERDRSSYKTCQNELTEAEKLLYKTN